MEQSVAHLAYVTLSGRFDVAAEAEVRSEFEDLAHRRNHIVIDMHDLTFFGSTALGLIYRCARELSENGWKMVVVSPNPMVTQVLEQSSSTDIIRIANNQSDALDMVTGG